MPTKKVKENIDKLMFNPKTKIFWDRLVNYRNKLFPRKEGGAPPGPPGVHPAGSSTTTTSGGDNIYVGFQGNDQIIERRNKDVIDLLDSGIFKIKPRPEGARPRNLTDSSLLRDLITARLLKGARFRENNQKVGDEDVENFYPDDYAYKNNADKELGTEALSQLTAYCMTDGKPESLGLPDNAFELAKAHILKYDGRLEARDRSDLSRETAPNNENNPGDTDPDNDQDHDREYDHPPADDNQRRGFSGFNQESGNHGYMLML